MPTLTPKFIVVATIKVRYNEVKIRLAICLAYSDSSSKYRQKATIQNSDVRQFTPNKLSYTTHILYKTQNQKTSIYVRAEVRVFRQPRNGRNAAKTTKQIVHLILTPPIQLAKKQHLSHSPGQ